MQPLHFNRQQIVDDTCYACSSSHYVTTILIHFHNCCRYDMQTSQDPNFIFDTQPGTRVEVNKTKAYSLKTLHIPHESLHIQAVPYGRTRTRTNFTSSFSFFQFRFTVPHPERERTSFFCVTNGQTPDKRNTKHSPNSHIQTKGNHGQYTVKSQPFIHVAMLRSSNT